MLFEEALDEGRTSRDETRAAQEHGRRSRKRGHVESRAIHELRRGPWFR